MDALQRTERLKSAGAITALDLTYAYDTNSRITSITDGSTPGANAAGKTHSVANLQYDALGHMTHADGWWGTGTFEYDGFGNLGRRWLSETGANPRRIWNFYDANNRLFVTDDSLPTASGGASWHSHSYDDRGNITRSGSSANNQHTMFMTYDMSDQMVGMSGHNLQEAPLTASYQYNGAGKRVYTNHNGRESYPMYDAGGALRAVYKVHDGELVEQIALQNGHPLAKWTGSTLTYLHADHLGTPIRGTHGLGGTGLTLGAETFQDFSTPYGLNPTSGWHGNGGSGFDPATGQGSNCGVTGFTTHAKDCESGLQHMQARQYSPVSGRFLSVDPVGFASSGGNPGYFNRYSYAFNDPINMIDPTGMIVEGTGFDEGEFDRVENDAQTASDAAGAAAGALSDLRSAIKSGGDLTTAQQSHKSQFESVFGEGSATTKNLKRAAKSLRQTSDALDSGSDLVFNKPTAAQATRDFGGSPGGALAYALKGEVNVLPGYFSYDKSKSSFLIGHEGIHIARGSSHIPQSLRTGIGTTGASYRSKAVSHWAGSKKLFKDAGVLDCYVGASC